jgi:hypothetical protein
MHFNTEATFTRVDFRRDDQTGVWKHHGVKWSIDHEDVNSWQSGQLTLKNGETIIVEEDWDSIKAILDLKREEKAEFEEYLRRLEIMGMAAMPGGDE